MPELVERQPSDPAWTHSSTFRQLLTRSFRKCDINGGYNYYPAFTCVETASSYSHWLSDAPHPDHPLIHTCFQIEHEIYTIMYACNVWVFCTRREYMRQPRDPFVLLLGFLRIVDERHMMKNLRKLHIHFNDKTNRSGYSWFKQWCDLIEVLISMRCTTEIALSGDDFEPESAAQALVLAQGLLSKGFSSDEVMAKLRKNQKLIQMGRKERKMTLGQEPHECGPIRKVQCDFRPVITTSSSE